MQTLTPRTEASILAALVAKIETVTDPPGISLPNAPVNRTIPVIADEPLLDSKQDILDTICIQNVDDETEVAYIKVDFSGFEDLSDVGCEDNPGAYAVYNLHVFQQYADKRGDGSTSLDDIKTLVLNLRNEFLRTENNARKMLDNCESQPLVQKSFIVLDNDPLTGAYGHFTDLTAKIEVL